MERLRRYTPENTELANKYSISPADLEKTYVTSRMAFASSFETVDRVDDPFIVYRTVVKNTAPAIGSVLTAIYKENVALSTSISAVASLEFGSGISRCCLEEILICEGAKVLYIANSSLFKNEQEILLPFNARFVVVAHRLVDVQFEEGTKTILVASLVYVPLQVKNVDAYVTDAMTYFDDATRYSTIPDVNNEYETKMALMRSQYVFSDSESESD
jgi:hypothetical protein